MNLNPTIESAGLAGGEAAVLSAFPFSPELEGETPPQPLVRIREEHNISRRDIDPDALKVLYRLSRNNYIAYLVGGGVRDLLLGRKPKDFDISTNAKPEQIRTLFRNCILIGRRFRLAHIRYGDKIIETSTFRRTPETVADPTDPEADLFQRDDNLFGTPQEDALRRDFTVNGLFYDIESFSIIDYVGGMEDLAARRIRSIGDPCIRFREDPVRMVRAVRFASRLDFVFDPDTLEAIRKHGEELTKASPARLLEEITRLFAFSSGEKSVRLLQSTGLLRVILPEVADCLESEKTDCGTFWERLRALDRGDTVLPDATPALIFATLLLEPLKRKLDRDWAADEFPRLKFDKVHSFLEPLSQRLRFPRKLVDRIVHMYLAQNRFTNPGGKRGSIANFVTQDSFHESLALAEITFTAESLPQGRLNQWRDMLAERIYGREENGGERRSHQQEREHESHERHQQPGAAEETPSGKKLSRSARRRRNKKLRHLHQREEAGAATMELSAIEEIPEGIPPEPAVEAAAPVPAASTAAEAGEPESTRKSGRRSRRGRGKKKEAEKEAPPKAASKPVEAKDPEMLEGPVKPLTAAAFYAPPPPLPPPPEPEKPEPKKKGGRKAKAAAEKPAAKGKAKAKAKAKSKKDEDEKPETSESVRIVKEKPPAMDRADEADIPMHWLDEI